MNVMRWFCLRRGGGGFGGGAVCALQLDRRLICQYSRVQRLAHTNVAHRSSNGGGLWERRMTEWCRRGCMERPCRSGEARAGGQHNDWRIDMHLVNSLAS